METYLDDIPNEGICPKCKRTLERNGDRLDCHACCKTYTEIDGMLLEVE